jgi:uncharacterized protein YicC (UPF0701 family)
MDARRRAIPEGIRKMQPEPLEQVVRNVDARLTRVEQILPTLVTKAEMRAAIAEAIAPLATKTDVAEEGERSRSFAKVLYEQLRSDIGLLAEHLSAVMVKLEAR